MKPRYGSTVRNQRGVYFIVGAVLIVVLLAVVAIIFGLGRITADKARLQAVNNLMAMAAIEAFMDCTPDTVEGKPDEVEGCETPADYSNKANAALVAANKFARLNTLQGAAKPLGDLKLAVDGGGAGGAVYIGRWLQEAAGGDTCDEYPCFVKNSDDCDDIQGPGCGVSAVRVEFNTQPDNPIFIPLGKFVGSEIAEIKTVATTSVVPRCAAFVLDVSGSSSAETHQRFQALGPVVGGVQTTIPANPSSFSIRSWPPTGDPVTSGFDCDHQESENASHWCNNLTMRKWDDRNEDFNGDPFKHFRSDYANTKGDDFAEIPIKGIGVLRPKVIFDRFVDRRGARQYDGPQPLVSFLKAFNAGIQQMRRQSVGGDAAALIGFNSEVVSNSVADSARALSNKFGFLLQLTNPDNRGTFTWDDDDEEYDEEDKEIHPNFIDAGWYPHFPDSGSGGTDIYSALAAALESVSSCPASAKKMIIIASDGIPNCSDRGTGFPCSIGTFCPGCPADPTWSGICNNGFTCRDSYTAYMYNENRLLDMSPGSLLSRLIESKVAVTVLMRGDIVKPNFMNVRSPTTNEAMTQSEARSLGYGGPLSCPGGAGGCPLKFFDFSSGNDAADFKVKSKDDPFLRANGLMGDIAFRTGGIWCPLQNPLEDGNPAYEDVDGIPTLRNSTSIRSIGNPEYRPLYNLSIGGQAIKCIKDAIGGIPFTLVEGDLKEGVLPPPTPTP